MGLAYAAHLGAHVLSPDEVVLLSERDRFALNGCVHAALARLLDGSRTADDLVEELGGEHPPAHVHLALLRLQRSGFVVEGAPAAAPAVVVAATAPGDVGAGSGAAVAVTVAGVPEEWARTLQDAVGTIGRSPGAGLTVCLVDDYLRPELVAAAAAALDGGPALLPVRPVGRWLWFGPLLRGPDARPAWTLFDQRMRMNRYADVAALERGRRCRCSPTTARRPPSRRRWRSPAASPPACWPARPRRS